MAENLAIEHGVDAGGKDAGFEQHPLYVAAMEHMAAGDTASAAAGLRSLAAEFPEAQALQDLAVRAELKAALAPSAEAIPAARGQPTPVLRNLVLILLILVGAIILFAGFSVVYSWTVRPTRQATQLEMQVRTLRQQAAQYMTGGDWGAARDAYNALLQAVPGDPTAQAGIEYANRREQLDLQYVEAVAAQQAGDWPHALDLLRSLQAQDASYPGVAARIAAVQGQIDMEAQWQAAQQLAQQGDAAATIAALNALRARYPDFRRAEIEDQIYQACAGLGMQYVQQAQGDPERLRQAIGYLDQALALRPTQGDLNRERRQARQFVSGAEAFARNDWIQALDAWGPLYEAQPDYQGGVLPGYLRQAYPLAARQLIAQANGDAATLALAIRYLDGALALDSGNQELIEEKRLAAEYIAGTQAFAEEDWTLAIARWGPIHALRPDYQNGVLYDRLRTACAKSLQPNETYCLP